MPHDRGNQQAASVTRIATPAVFWFPQRSWMKTEAAMTAPSAPPAITCASVCACRCSRLAAATSLMQRMSRCLGWIVLAIQVA